MTELLKESVMSGKHFLIHKLPPGSKFQRAKEFRDIVYTIIRDAHSSFPKHKQNPNDWASMADRLTDENWEHF